MPEMPEMQALSERLAEAFGGAVVESLTLLGISALKTVAPAPADLAGARVTGTGRRAKYVIVELEGAGGRGPMRLLLHLGNAGRLDIEEPAKSTRPRGSLARLSFADGRGVLVREHGTQHKAGVWILAAGDEGPLAGLGPEVGEEDFAQVLRHSESPRQLHTLLRDQRFLAGVGRGYADDALNRAGLSPFASLRALTADERERLVVAVRETLEEALESERRRSGGLSAAKLGDRFAVHNRAGQPCPRCGEPLQRVSFESHDVAYCPACQTRGRVLADRRLSRLLR